MDDSSVHSSSGDESDADLAKLIRACIEVSEDPFEKELNLEDALACLEECVRLNREKQEKLHHLLLRIDKLMAYTWEQDNKIEQILKTNMQVKPSHWNHDYMNFFFKPYFRDAQGFPPPRNRDELKKLSNGEPNVATVDTVCKWQSWEMKLLDGAVRKNAFERLLAPLTARKEQILEQKRALLDQDPESKKEREHEQSELEQRLRETEIEMKNVIGEPLFRMLSDPLANIDWMAISATDFKGRRSEDECRTMWCMCLKPGVNRKSWTKEETDRLMELAQQHRLVRWDNIAKSLGTGRTCYQSFLHYQVTLNRTRAKWTPQEDHRLKVLVKKYTHETSVPFNQIARHMPGRTAHAIRQRWKESLNPDRKSGRFSMKEDILLATARHLHEMTFRQISILIPGRTETQLRSRYKCLENVTPTLPFTPEEDQKLVSLAQKGNPKLCTWSSLVSEFPERTRSQLRGRYMRLLDNTKTHTKMVTHFSANKSMVWQKLQDKVNCNTPVDTQVQDTLALVSDVNKKTRRRGRKVKLRDNIDREITQIFRSHYAQPKGRRKKVYTHDDITMIGSKARQIADVLRANLDWESQDTQHCQDEGQRIMLEQLRSHHTTGWQCSGTTLTHVLPPNVTTIIGLRTLQLVEPFVLRWSNGAVQSDNGDKVVQVLERDEPEQEVPQEEEERSFAAACELFKQRCVAMFLWPIILSQQEPHRLLTAAPPQQVEEEVEEVETIPIVPKIKLTKLQRKRWLKSRWQKYRDNRDNNEPVVAPGRKGKGPKQAQSKGAEKSPAKSKIAQSQSKLECTTERTDTLMRSKRALRRRADTESSEPETKKNKGGVRNNHGKFVKK